MARVFLIGFMGVGKTTLGRRIAEQLGYSFIDLDQAIEDRTGRSVTQIFEEEGEVRFRTLEARELDHVVTRKDVIVATGGGTPALPLAMQKMSEAGNIVWLKASVDTVIERTAQTSSRPLIANLSQTETRLRIEKLLDSRKPFYSQADFAVDTDGQDPGCLVDTICARLKSSWESK